MRWGVFLSCLSVAATALAVPAALLWATPACADSWLPPETETYFSADKRCRLTVVPRDIEDQLAFFEDKVDGKEPAGQRRRGNPTPNATLERQRPDGSWERIWSQALVNDVAPTNAIIVNSGRYVITFDNWHSTGYGDDAIVIYDVGGGAVRRFSVEKLLGADYFAALPHSVSSVRWKDGVRIEGQMLRIDVLVPGEWAPDTPERHVSLVIDLASGAVRERGYAAWRDARAEAARFNAAARDAERARRKAFVAPLAWPAANDEGAWQSYLREAFYRLDPRWEDEVPSSTVLRARADDGYEMSRDWIRAGLEEPARAMMFAGIEISGLQRVLASEAARLRPGALRGTRLYVAAPESARPHLETTFAASGVTLILLDPKKPIPQRPERLRQMNQTGND